MEDITLTGQTDPEKRNSQKPITDQVSAECMDITKGRLDDISRPASATLSEIRRASQERPGALELLSPDLTHTQQVQASTAENGSDQEESDGENEDPELGEAIRRMKRLDRMLAVKVSAERALKQKGREQRRTLWLELQKPIGSCLKTSVCRQEQEAVSIRTSSYEMENTRRFLALTPNNSQDCGEEEDFIPVFDTEVLDLKFDTDTRREMDERPQVECVGQQEAQTADGGAHSRGRQDFIRRNIALAGASGHTLTHAERERVEELLRDLEEEQSDTDLLTEPQMVSSALSAGEGFSPEPSELHSLLHIDSRLQLLLPVRDFLSVRSRCSEHSPSQGSLEENSGDRVLRREDERRLQEIQLQLQLLEDTQQSSSCRLSEAQMRNLLQECEEEILGSPEASLGIISALLASPSLSSLDLTEPGY